MYNTNILEVNLLVLAFRLFHEGLSPINGALICFSGVFLTLKSLI